MKEHNQQQETVINLAAISADFDLKKNSVDVWLCHLADFEDKKDHFLSQFSSEEKSRAERFKFAIHRNRFIVSHGFVRNLLAKYLNVKPEDIEYAKGEQGKPCIFSNNLVDLQFNLSHTQDIAILAVTRHAAVGIDIEFNDRKTDWQGICKRFFNISEQEALFSLPEAQQANAFFDLWTRKEAYMKVLGTGLSLSPLDFTLSVFPENPALISHHSTKFASLKEVEFRSVNLPESLSCYNATLALAAKINQYQVLSFA